jgi:hypothetical protein
MQTPLSSAPHQVHSLADLANNPIDTAEVNDVGATGDVLSGTGNLLPVEIEEKNLGVTYGGKEGKGKKNPMGKNSARHKKRNREELEVPNETPKPPYESERKA